MPVYNRESNVDKNQGNVGSSLERTDERIDQTGEVFTPEWLCMEMISNIPEHVLKDPSSTFLDNSAGSGNYFVALKKVLLQYHEEQHILDNMLYVVELMKDNHAELCERLGVPVTHPHYVNHNALTYDYSFGEPVGLEAFF